MKRRTYRLPESQLRHLVGVSALHDGDCVRCPDPILVNQRVVPQGDGWIHASCASGADE
ncbi:hypothetical protein FB382_004356 [Nocardioides ginsengisegetis]|uniref:Uncharacterized protein n=1 Tax=Nocardioides ginsengisegetis TaxID=661491 RepID=A0A7W3J3F6_9ACTN|nr:hypothetical protein [Nocardioides ginsengisegetis]MBA8805581.1 hypothetical protein [Nocardioides ginsengisegetis]MBA8806005.1 hypothetical protein [Nocardioides ginsengisegetis]